MILRLNFLKRVISKKEWLRLKKEYLDKQKTNLSELKEKLKSVKKVSNGMEVDKKRKATKMLIEEEPVVGVESDYKNCIIKLTPKTTFDENAYELFKLSRQQFKNEKLKDFCDQIAYVDIDKNINKI